MEKISYDIFFSISIPSWGVFMFLSWRGRGGGNGHINKNAGLPDINEL